VRNFKRSTKLINHNESHGGAGTVAEDAINSTISSDSREGFDLSLNPISNKKRPSRNSGLQAMAAAAEAVACLMPKTVRFPEEEVTRLVTFKTDSLPTDLFNPDAHVMSDADWAQADQNKAIVASSKLSSKGKEMFIVRRPGGDRKKEEDKDDDEDY
jgi:hypothetical protein